MKKNKFKLLFISIICLIFFGIARDSEAKNLYVNNSGSPACLDSTTYANNNASNPWCTIGRAAWGSTNKATPNTSEAAQAGDFVLVSAGTYLTTGTDIRYEPALNPVNSGSVENPITFQAEGIVTIQPDVYISGSVQSATAGTITLDSSASDVDDFYKGWYIRITAGTGAGQSRFISLLQIPGQEHITTGSYNGTTRTAQLQNEWDIIPDESSTYQLTKPGPLIGTNGRDYIVWDGFRIVENDSYHPDTGSVVVWDSDYVTIKNLEIIGTNLPVLFDNHNAIRVEYSNYILVKNNKIHGLRSTLIEGTGNPQNEAAIMIYSSNNGIFENNEIYDIHNGFFPKGGDGTNGGHIFRYNKIHDAYKAIRISYHSNVQIYQNIIYNADIAMQPAESISNISFYNNTIYNGSSGGYNWYAFSGINFYNNIFSTVTNPFNLEGGAGAFTSNYNFFHSYNSFINGGSGNLNWWQSNSGLDLNSSEGNPGFINPSGNDFHLASDSPAKIAGQGGEIAGAYINDFKCIGLESECDMDDISPANPSGLNVQ
ncbi:MAG: right-handed parallel beta-helix repeat-containing protein [Candidatus Moraniibacteriota bacterium]